MSFLKEIQKKIYIISVNMKIKQAKYVHIMFNDKFNKPFVDFLNRNFNPKEHLILCKNFYEFPFPEGKNVIELKYLNKLKFNKPEKIIFHSLFDNDVVEYLYNHPDILKKKSYWVIWGGDLYDAVRGEKNDFVRKNFKGYLGVMDKEYACKKYNINAPFYNVHYPFSTLLNIDNKAYLKKTKNKVRVLINNSCDESTLEMLDILSKFKDKNIEITTILSYGETKYKEKIIHKGKEIFGKNFDYLDKYLQVEDYKNYMKDIDIFILNQNRQQGVGNIVLNIQLGNKVFIRNEISTFKYLNNIENVKIFDTNKIVSLTFEEFIKNNFVEQNIVNIKNFTDFGRLIQHWSYFFNESKG